MKLFWRWHVLKETLHNKKKKTVYFEEREIWFIHLGENVGHEQDGKGNQFLRPVLVLKKYNRHLLTVIPLTSQCKKGKYYMRVVSSQHVPSTVIFSQVRTIDSHRLHYKKGMVSKEDFLKIKKRLRKILF